MKLLSGIFGLLGLAALAAVGWLCNKAGGMPLSALFLDASMVTKVALLLLIPGLLLVALLPNGRGQSRGVILPFMWILLGLAGLAGGRGLLSTWIAVDQTHTTNLMVIAPSLAEDLLPLGLGLLIVAIGAFKIASARRAFPAQALG